MALRHMTRVMMDTEPLQIALRVTQVLEDLGISYFIGGSLASSLYGQPRSTMDADIVADFKAVHIDPFVSALASEFYVDAESIREAIRTRRSFNLIHQGTGFKVDVFINKRRAFDDAQFSRRVKEMVLTAPERSAQFASPEDSILAKLEWYRLGGESSDRQWSDVLAMLKARPERLDLNYMEEMANQLGVADLLARARRQAG